MSLTFYYGSGSPFAWRVWLALEHKQIAYELKVLSFDRGDTRAPEFLAINPRGRVPTIVHDGFKLWESLAILEYLEESFPQKPLLARDPRTRANLAGRRAWPGHGSRSRRRSPGVRPGGCPWRSSRRRATRW